MKLKCNCQYSKCPHPKKDRFHCASVATKKYQTDDFDLDLCDTCFETRVKLSGPINPLNPNPKKHNSLNLS